MHAKILVMGGAGYIGSHTYKALAAAGYIPVAFDNLSADHRWAVKWGPLAVADIADRARIADDLRVRHTGHYLSASQSHMEAAPATIIHPREKS
jgi:UDP-glucose 4-epimerase